MKLTVLGSGTFFVNAKQTASAFLLEADDKKILIDCGPGTLVRLSQIGVSVFDLDAVFITHLHPDHTSDLFPLFMNFRIADVLADKKPARFPVFYGPGEIGEYFRKYSQLTQLHSVENWDKIKLIGVKKLQKIGKLEIWAFQVRHIAFNFSAEAYAYRFTIGCKTIVFSGDAAKCSGIKRACRDADLFVCDCSFPKRMKGLIHLDTEQIGQISQKCGVKRLILTHFYPFYDPQVLLEEVKEYFSREIIVGRDLMKISLAG